MHEETETHGLIFEHYAYATEEQLFFKESSAIPGIDRMRLTVLPETQQGGHDYDDDKVGACHHGSRSQANKANRFDGNEQERKKGTDSGQGRKKDRPSHF